MFVEVPDLVGEWFADPVYGINALLPAVARKAGDTQPPPVSILVSVRSSVIARLVLPEDPADYPIVVVLRNEPGTLLTDIRQGVWDVHPFELGVSYIVRDVASDEALRHSGYTMVAILRSLWHFFDPDNAGAVAARARNNVTIQALSSLEIGPPQVELKDATALDSCRLGLRVRHNLPGG